MRIFKSFRQFIDPLPVPSSWAPHKIEGRQSALLRVSTKIGGMPVMFFTLSSYELDLSAYDATYLLLAEHLSCPLATLDKDLRKAAKKRGVAIAALDQQWVSINFLPLCDSHPVWAWTSAQPIGLGCLRRVCEKHDPSAFLPL